MRSSGVAGLAGFFLFLATGCGSEDAEPPAADAAIRIMWVEPLSGPLASVGRPSLAGWRFAVEEINEDGGILGHPIVLETCDNEGDPRVSADCVDRAIDEGFGYVAQGMSSAAAGAVLDAVDKHNDRRPDRPMVYLNWAAQSERLTEELCSYWQFRFEPHVGMRAAALASYLGDRDQDTRLYIINQDYSMGHSAEQSMLRELERRAPDVEVVETERHPFNRVSDWRPYVDKIAQSGATSVFTANWGPDLLRLINTADEAGLDVEWLTIFGNLRGTVGVIGEAGVGRLHVVTDYHPNVDDEVWLARQREYRSRFDDQLIGISEYRALRMLEAAVEEAGSIDPGAVAEALEGLEVDFGETTTRMRPEDHQAVMPMVIAVMSDEAAMTQDGTEFGFETVAWVEADRAAPRIACDMSNRPG